MSDSPADLAADTAVRAVPNVPGRYVLSLPDHWDYLLPSGGVAMTCALRAAQAELAEPLLRLASTTAIFATPIHTGALVADVAVLRRGKASAQVRVALRDANPRPAKPADASEGALPDNVGLEVIATFLRDRRGPDVKAVAFPPVRSLAEALSVDDDASNNPHRRFRFYHQVECKIAAGERFWLPEFAAGGSGRYARWLRYKVPQRDAKGRLDRLALPPLVDTMPTALHRAIGPGGYRFHAPSLDLTTYIVDDTTREWLLVDVTLRRARMGWAIADAEIWDDEGTLIAYGSQAMYLHNLSGEPPVIDASCRTP